MLLIKSHSYIINMVNVLHFRAHTEFDGTLFYMHDDHCVQITCPYDEVVRQMTNLLPQLIDGRNVVLVLDY